jgi:hypothetical protein
MVSNSHSFIHDLQGCHICSIVNRCYVICRHFLANWRMRVEGVGIIPKHGSMNLNADALLQSSKHYLPFSTRPKNQPSSQIKGLGNGFSIRAPGQYLVPAQPQSGQSLRLSAIGVCHPDKKLSGEN